MAVYQGIVAPNGTVVRRQGQFTVVSKTGDRLVVRFPGDNVTKAFVLATPWRNDGDIGRPGIAASPDPQNREYMIFAVEDYYGVSFRVQSA